MALTFTRAPTVEVGEALKSSQMASLADAFNDRIKSGLGDSAWRIAMYWFNLFRQVRNPDGGILFPSMAEFFEIYQHLDPTETDSTWPVAEPGEDQGANLANVMNQFVFGVGSLPSEEDRVGAYITPWLDAGPPTNLAEMWLLGKYQRGAYDPATGAQNAPAFYAAQSHYNVQSPTFSPHGKAYGGFFPTPLKLATGSASGEDCGDTDDVGLGLPSLAIKLTALSTTADTSSLHGTITTNSDGYSVCTYAGSCPDWTTFTGVGHVLAMMRTPWAIYVFVEDGADGVLDVFPTSLWFEGPYEGNGELTRYDGGQIHRAVWGFTTDFRGTSAERAEDGFSIEQIGFDFQAFHTRQYYLAPAVGEYSGGELSALYPRIEITTDTPGATPLNFMREGMSRHYLTTGFVAAGFFAKATNLDKDVVLYVRDEDDNLLESLTLTAGESSEAMLWSENKHTPEFVYVESGDDGIVFGAGGGTLELEVAELYDYKPQFQDAYLLLRLGSTMGGFAGSVDTYGAIADSPALFDAYATNGCITNAGAAGLASIGNAVNLNPVYEAARKQSREQVHILNRNNFVSYEVADGKSILRFTRWAYGLVNQRADLFYNIAPPYDPVEEIVDDEVYVVRATSGAVTYRGADYANGAQFTGAEGISDFQTTGDAAAYVYDGIRATARKKGWSNEWVMFMNTHTYHPSDSSLWKTEAYGDYFTWNDRCQFYAYTGNKTLSRHINYQDTVNVVASGDTWIIESQGERMNTTAGAEYISPEAPPGYRYALSANGTASTSQFYKSCRIYEPPYEIESCVIEPGATMAEDVVKITFKTRFTAHEDAPATVDPDPTSWSAGDISDLEAEDYRTDDNAMRQFAHWQLTGSGYHYAMKTGDGEAENYVSSLPDNPFASIIPHFFFVHLLEKPFADDNNVQQSADTRCTIDQLRQSEVYLKAMCEGFVDETTSTTYICDGHTDAGPYDYTFENLCYDAFAGVHCGAFSLAVIPEHPAGHGPMPNTETYADVFNRISSAVNKLDKVRVMLPFEFQARSRTADQSDNISLDWGFNIGGGCQENVTLGGVKLGVAFNPPEGGTWSSWAASGGDISASSGNYFSSSLTLCDAPGGSFVMRSDLEQVQIRYADTSASEIVSGAMPPLVLELFQQEVQPFGFMASAEKYIKKYQAVTHAVNTDCDYCSTLGGAGYLHDGSSGYSLDVQETTVDGGCGYFSFDMTLRPDSQTPSDHKIQTFLYGGAPQRCSTQSIVTSSLYHENDLSIPILQIELA